MSDQDEAVDKSFAFFLNEEGFGPAVDTEPASPAQIETFRGKVPDPLLRCWDRYGFGGYGKGLLWIVDPDAWEPALEAWIGDMPFMESDAYHVVARSAFGKLFLWGTRSGQSLDVLALRGMIFPRGTSRRLTKDAEVVAVRSFFTAQSKADLDQADHLGKPLFERALKTLGPLAPDEMYGFEPALALGGKPELKNLRKFKAVEHLVLLAQLGERKIMRDIVKDAEGAGLMPPR